MSVVTQSLETLCNEINQMAIPSRIRAIELILHSIDDSVTEKPEQPQERERLSELEGIGKMKTEEAEKPLKRGRLSELKGIGKGTWAGIDIDKFIREERDAWD